MKNLDLYAKIEPYIGFDEAYKYLYKLYLEELSNYNIDTILDVGCGNGNFLLQLQKIYQAEGIDISPQMVQIANSKGVNAKCKYLSEVDSKYDAILAVADVLNYLDDTQLKEFFADISLRLHDNGIFLCDINTLFGFEEVTAGSLSIDKDELFISIDSEFEDDTLYTKITLFEKIKDCFKKDQAEIVQYYHVIKKIENSTSLKLISIKEVALFSDDSDKTILLFKKEKIS